MPPPAASRDLTTVEVARRLGFPSPDAFNKWRSRRQARGLEVPRAIRRGNLHEYDPLEVESFLEDTPDLEAYLRRWRRTGGDA
jgi:transposase-like protein